MVYTNSGLRYTREDNLFKGRGGKGSARPAADTVGKAVWRGEVSMKSRKHVLKIAAFFAVVAMLLGCTISTWARDIKKDYRTSLGYDEFTIELNSGESISKLKVNKKGLKLKVLQSYSETQITDPAQVKEINKEREKNEQIRNCRIVRIRTTATKKGKYKVTFNIKKGKKTEKKGVKCYVHVSDSYPVTSVKFAGKTYKTTGKYQGSKYYSPYPTFRYFVTKKSSGKFSAKAGAGYKIVATTYVQHDKDGKTKEVPYKKNSVKLYRKKTETSTNTYSGYKSIEKEVDQQGYASFYVYLQDKYFPENNTYTDSAIGKTKYARCYYCVFYKFY